MDENATMCKLQELVALVSRPSPVHIPSSANSALVMANAAIHRFVTTEAAFTEGSE